MRRSHALTTQCDPAKADVTGPENHSKSYLFAWSCPRGAEWFISREDSRQSRVKANTRSLTPGGISPVSVCAHVGWRHHYSLSSLINRSKSVMIWS